jgi:hypothetical protein
MKRVTIIVRQPEISRIFPQGLKLNLDDYATVLDSLRAADEQIKKACRTFPVKGFESLLQLVYHPHEDRFYRQVAIQAYTKSKGFLSIRENLRMLLPDQTTIILVPDDGCQTDWEEPVK